jgi:hypothetical protein
MKLARILAAVLLVGGLLMLSTAALALPTPMCFIVGDVDNYGNIPGAGDQVPAGTNIWPGPGIDGADYDGRSAAEMAATDGAQITDVYSAIYPGVGPNATETASVFFPTGYVIHDGSFVMAMGDFQALPYPDGFGSISMNINGVALDPATQSTPDTWNDGFQASVIRSFVLTPAQIAAANAAGQVIINFDRGTSTDFIAFDWFKLCANVEPVPVPPSAILLGSGLLGLLGLGFRKNRG